MAWNFKSMRAWIDKHKKDPSELLIYDQLVAWGEEKNEVEFQDSDTPSFVIRIPGCRVPSQILTVQGRKLRFYSSHFIGNPSHYVSDPSFPKARQLQEQLFSRLVEEFGWQNLIKAKQNVSKLKIPEYPPANEGTPWPEPSIPFEALAADRVGRLIEILDEFCSKRAAI